MKIRVLLSFFIIYQCLAINFFNIHSFDKKSGAVCLDGSEAAIYTFVPDSSTYPNKLLIIFEQNFVNGWCFEENLSQSLKKCQQFTKGDFGSSANYSSNFLELSGIISSQSQGQFQNWPKVYIKNCDGGAFIGDKVVKYKLQQLHFKGSAIVHETIKYLNKIGWLQNRQQVVIGGSFNAGLAALQWSSTFQQNTNAKVKLLADSAYFLNVINRKYNTSLLENRLITLEKLILTDDIFPNKKCAESNPNEVWKCYFAQEITKYVDEQIFFSGSLYNAVHIKLFLGFICAERLNSLSQCEEEHRQIIQEYHKNLTQQFTATIKQKEGRGAFGISCIDATMFGSKYTDDLWRVPMITGPYVSTALKDWILGKEVIIIDSVQWPHNQPCANKLANLISQ